MCICCYISGSISNLTCCYLTARWRGLLGIWLSELELSALSRLRGRVWKGSSVKGVIPGSASFSGQTHWEGPGISFPPVEIHTKKSENWTQLESTHCLGSFNLCFTLSPSTPRCSSVLCGWRSQLLFVVCRCTGIRCCHSCSWRAAQQRRRALGG